MNSEQRNKRLATSEEYLIVTMKQRGDGEGQGGERYIFNWGSR